MWWTGEKERATDPFPFTDLQFVLVRWSFGNYVARFASVPNFRAHAVDLWKVYHSHYRAWSAWSGASGVGDGWREGEWVRQVFSPLRHLFSSLHICPTLFSLFVSVFCLRLVVWTDNPQAPACFLIKLNNICGRPYLLKAKRVGQIHRCVRPCYYLDETSTHKSKGDLKKKKYDDWNRILLWTIG